MKRYNDKLNWTVFFFCFVMVFSSCINNETQMIKWKDKKAGIKEGKHKRKYSNRQLSSSQSFDNGFKSGI